MRTTTRWSHSRTLLGVLVAALALLIGSLGAGSAAMAAQAAPSSLDVDLGPSVKVFDPTMPLSEIRATVDAVYAEQVGNQFGTLRYALLFKPGVYGSATDPLIVRVGYYTEVAGLGRSPGDVTINGHVDVYNQCDPTGCYALNNFWRSLANLTINVTGLKDCQSSATFWAVSQASPMRRVDIQGGNLSLMDYCSAGPQWASGGFIADSRTGFVINGSQQQWLTRDSQVGGWSNWVWNQVFAGVQGAPKDNFGAGGYYTTLATNPASRERPFLWVDDSGAWQVFVPDPRTDSVGPTWTSGPTPGHSLPLADFLVVSPSTPWSTVNAALAQGRHLLFQPGVYDVSRTISVKRANTVVLGLGLPTLTSQGGAVPLEIADVPGVDVAGLTIDAGMPAAPALLRVGTGRAGNGKEAKASDPANPTGIQDVFFRIGGPHAGSAEVALEVHANNVILDDIWAWRADHGEGVGWTKNTADTGVVVTGDDVTATGLFSEHFQKENVIWSGERGRTVFFQNELPYDAPNQASWQHDGILGYAAYKVADSVRTHQLSGGGAYIFTNVNPTLHASHGFEVPDTPGVLMHDLLTVSLNHAGTIDHVINDTGAPVTPDYQGPSTVVNYP